MKKTLIASAIAAATFSGAVAAQESNLPTVYGNIQYALTHTNVDGAGSTVDHFDNGTTLGVKHDHEIAPGITGFLKLELEGINADDKAASSGIDKLDEAYIGVEGDSFGKIWVGSDDSTYERAVVKIGNFHEVGSDIFGVYETGEGDLVQYETPSFGGLTLGAAVQINGDGDAANAKKSYPYQLAATYAVDALSVSVAMDSNDGADDANNENSYGLAATFNAGDLSITGEYQTRKDVADIYGVIGAYTLGANQFALSYQVNDDDVTGDKNDTVILQALHNLSDNMYVYVEGYLSGADGATYYDDPDGVTAGGDERSIAAVGAVYYF
ncbi:MAG: porin [Marinobacter sp.]|uniref:porin n=1 Tax=Marinobacter sp. TaxID=50741 RepID=UPI00396DAB33